VSFDPAPFEIHDVHPASSVTFTQSTAFYTDVSTNRIEGLWISWNEYDTSLTGNGSLTLADLSPSSFSRFHVEELSGRIWVFFQWHGNDISLLSYNKTEALWREQPVL